MSIKVRTPRVEITDTRSAFRSDEHAYCERVLQAWRARPSFSRS
jgi:hypothetical protein